MKTINNYDAVQASSGEFARPTAGGYICKIINVEDVPMGANGKGDYLKIDYDIAVGELKDYYKEANKKFGGDWFANFIRSYKETALGMFKHFTNCVEQSNPNWSWDFATLEVDLIGRLVGLVLGEEEYRNSAGEIKTKLVVKEVKTIDDIKNGNFKIPAPKKLPQEAPTPQGFETMIASDGKLPF